MAALTATDWSVTINDTWIEGKKKHTRVTITLASGGEYVAGGIPLPTRATLGLKSFLDVAMPVELGATSEFVWEYDSSAHKLIGYEQTTTTATGLSQLGTGDSPVAFSVVMVTTGW